MTTYGALGAAIVGVIPDWWKVPVGLVIIGLFVMWLKPSGLVGVERWLQDRRAPVVLGALAAVAMVVSWGSLRQISLLQDEAAYLLQAHLFSAGRWTDPSPPLPAFFEQPHVLVVPKLASKYFPGHSLLLTPGVWLGLPGLVPVALLALTAALTFVLARDVLGHRFGPWPALLAYLLWLSLVGYATWPRPSYMSEITTSALWLWGWWALLRWRDKGQLIYVVILATCVAWGVITRPLTMLAYALPTGALVLMIAWRRRRWRHVAAAAACALCILGIIPLWSAETTGDWRLTPHALYTADYLPWDVIGFGFRDIPPLRSLPPEVACLDTTFASAHRLHRPAVLPGQLVARTWGLLDDTFHGWRRGFLLLAIAALPAIPVELWVALATCAVLLASYLLYPQDPRYTIYYMETQATLVIVAALGVCAVAAAVGARRGSRAEESPTASARRQLAWWTVALTAFLVPVTVTTLQVTGQKHESSDMPRRQFVALVSALPGPRNVVFVHYPPTGACQQPDHGLIDNTPPLAAAKTWIVYDRGSENRDLLRAVPGRAPYLYDVESGTLQALAPDAVAAAERAAANR